MRDSVRIFIVADVRLYREGLALVLQHDERVTVMGAAARVDQALETFAVTRPEVILLSAALEEAIPKIGMFTAAVPEAKVIALAVPAVENEVVAWVEAGVGGFLTCEASLEDLVLAIEGAVRDELPCPPRLAAALLRRVATLAAEQSGSTLQRRLTLRERQVAELLGEGRSNKEIARSLQIELTTVKNHVHNILGKLHVRSRGEAVARLRRFGAHSDAHRQARGMTRAVASGRW